jgi:hypothetical protein
MKINHLTMILLLSCQWHEAVQANELNDQVICGTQASEIFVDWEAQVPQRIDVANRNAIKIVFRSQSSSFKKLPQIEVLNEYAGFECEPRSVKAKWTNDMLHRKGCFEAEIDWMPGGDWSGCTVQIHYPDSKEKTVIELFMRY